MRTRSKSEAIETTGKVSSFCDLLIEHNPPRANLKRFLSMPAASTSKKSRCVVCKEDYSKNYMKVHLKTKKHLKNMHKKRESRIKVEGAEENDDDAETIINDENE